MASRVRSCGRPAKAHPSLLKAIGPVGNRHGVGEVLLDQYHACPARLDVRKRGVDVANDDRGEAETELVAQQDARVRHQAAADGDHLLLPAGQRRARRVTSLPQHGKQPINRGEGPRSVKVPAVGADQQIFLDRERRKQPAAFRHQSEAELDDLERRQRADIAAIETHG